MRAAGGAGCTSAFLGAVFLGAVFLGAVFLGAVFSGAVFSGTVFSVVFFLYFCEGGRRGRRASSNGELVRAVTVVSRSRHTAAPFSNLPSPHYRRRRRRRHPRHRRPHHRAALTASLATAAAAPPPSPSRGMKGGMGRARVGRATRTVHAGRARGTGTGSAWQGRTGWQATVCQHPRAHSTQSGRGREERAAAPPSSPSRGMGRGMGRARVGHAPARWARAGRAARAQVHQGPAGLQGCCLPAGTRVARGAGEKGERRAVPCRAAGHRLPAPTHAARAEGRKGEQPPRRDASHGSGASPHGGRGQCTRHGHGLSMAGLCRAAGHRPPALKRAQHAACREGEEGRSTTAAAPHRARWGEGWGALGSGARPHGGRGQGAPHGQGLSMAGLCRAAGYRPPAPKRGTGRGRGGEKHRHL